MTLEKSLPLSRFVFLQVKRTSLGQGFKDADLWTMNVLCELLGILCKIPLVFMCVDIFLEERELNFHLIHKGVCH